MRAEDVPLWYGVIFMVNMQMAFLSPPFGYSLFYLKSVAPPQITMATIFKSAVPFIGPDLALLIRGDFAPSPRAVQSRVIDELVEGLRVGTGEVRAWISVAAAMNRPAKFVEYTAAHCTQTGCGFVYWPA